MSEPLYREQLLVFQSRESLFGTALSLGASFGGVNGPAVPETLAGVKIGVRGQSRTTAGASSRSRKLSRWLRMVRRPASSASPAQPSADGTPILAATAPQIALPTDIPPCITSRYMESDRARTQVGAMVWAA